MARKKTTIYLEPDLLTATETLAASSGRREYEVIEDALRAHVRSDEAVAGRHELRAMLDRWTEDALGLNEDEALELATREVHAYRHEQRAKWREGARRALVRTLRTSATLIDDPPPEHHGLRDPDDAYLLTLARSAKADYLVSGDGDLTSLSDPPGRR